MAETDPSVIAEIEQREQAASKGPWRAMADGNQYIYTDYLPTAKCVAAARVDGLVRAWNPYAYVAFGFKSREFETSRFVSADAEFIAHARTDIPYLLAALRSCEARITKLEAERDDALEDASYHADCRPNRRQAEAWRDDAKAMNDKWADERKRAEAAEARITDLEQQRDEARNISASRKVEIEALEQDLMLAARDHQTTALRALVEKWRIAATHTSTGYAAALRLCECADELSAGLAAPGPEPVADQDRTPE